MELQNGYMDEEISQSGERQMGGFSLFFSLKATKKMVSRKRDRGTRGGLEKENAEQCMDLVITFLVSPRIISAQQLLFA